MFMMNNISKHLGVRKISWRSLVDSWPKRVASPNMHPLLCSLAPKNKLWFLGLRYIWGNHSSPHETAYMLKNANIRIPNCFIGYSSQNHAQMRLRHFTEHLVGACLGMNSKGIGAMWHAQPFQNTT